eukprot:c7361_g1_i1.p1 GENE.c7361_g1_i1~~c7361_g1_i1.p1  ORF type:complete len:250 (-),score=102.72 c7361_g1_i1:35-784(-)
MTMINSLAKLQKNSSRSGFKETLAKEKLLKGLQYAYGLGCEQINYKMAIKYLTESKDLGNASAPVFLARLTKLGKGVSKSVNQAQALCFEALHLNIEQSANQGDEFSQAALGLMFYWGYGVPQDSHRAVFYYQKSAKQNNALAQYDLGILYHGDIFGRGSNVETSVQLITKSAEQQDADAQYILGMGYKNGQYLPRDEQKSVKWFKKAAIQNNILAQNELGLINLYGTVGIDNKKEALKWFYACVLGSF